MKIFSAKSKHPQILNLKETKTLKGCDLKINTSQVEINQEMINLFKITIRITKLYKKLPKDHFERSRTNQSCAGTE